MELNSDACFRAVRARDRRFDGRFFVGVTSTHIYCRPICPARPPKRENMRFYSNAAAAEGAGFRPCLRCRPERAPGLASVDAVSRLVGAAIAGIEEHALSSAKVADLAASLGITDRHLRRVTESELGVSPIELAQTQRLLLAKRLLGETNLSQTEIAFASGFGSVRRFNALFKSRYGLCPRALRGTAKAPEGLHCQLEFRPPFAWDKLLDYLRLRAIPGVEMADLTHYRRTVGIDAHQGWIAVSVGKKSNALNVEISPSLAPVIGAVIARVKRLFDLGALPDAVGEYLSQDPLLANVVRRIPGLRVAGAFDGFELAVRAILGQQVSVKGATTLAGRWAQAFGAQIATPYPELNRLTPVAQHMASVTAHEISALGIVGARARCLALLAPAVLERKVILSFAPNVEEQIEALMRLPGIGPWTAQYIAMRALHWPDAFPSGDLMLMRAANANHRQLQNLAEKWRPWRAYATHYLWQSLGVNP
ncbi:MAG TPA: AlkA N-terminal domain-containing protein [Steroidobacteraceae bacterium]|jgi:AraC family transcriptional regulator of adaptative response / DNA-3-methyladenine glycosylase II|nr:AlkA N-terminal domain-containing protein [Steroidobacteraceae bacterium]